MICLLPPICTPQAPGNRAIPRNLSLALLPTGIAAWATAGDATEKLGRTGLTGAEQHASLRFRQISVDVPQGWAVVSIHDPEADMTLTDHAPLPSHTGDEETPDLDVLNQMDDIDSVSDSPAIELSAPPKGNSSRSRGAARGGAKITARTVRTVLAKHAEISKASSADRSLLATLLGVRNDTDELVAHILSTPRLTLAGVDELEAIIEAAKVDPFSAIERAISFESAGRAIWSIIVALGLVEGNRPQKDADASLATARAASAITDTQARRLETLRELIRKGQ